MTIEQLKQRLMNKVEQGRLLEPSIMFAYVRGFIKDYDNLSFNDVYDVIEEVLKNTK